MVKHDRFPGIADWGSKILGLLLVLSIWFYVGREVFFNWPTFDLVGRGLATLGVIFIFWMGVGAVKSWLSGKEWKQMKRVEALRRHPQEAALYHIQPEVDETKYRLPIRLSVHLSSYVYLCFAAFWLVFLGIALAINRSSLNETGSLEVFIIGWVILGGIIIVLTGILMYQRIERTPRGLIVQKGLLRRTIPWEQATLFAIIRLKNSDSTKFLYELSSPRTLLRWDANYPGMSGVTFPRQRQEYVQQHEGLLASIHAYTELPLLDLR